MTFSPDTLELFKALIDQQAIQVGHPDFEDNALKTIQAKRELAEAMAEPLPTDD